MTVDRELLHGRWLHAHEEDTHDEMVFRPASAGLPPSRGRRGLELRPDGSYSEIRPGRDDRPQEHAGHWDVEGDELVLKPAEGDASPRTMRVVAADGDAIVVGKPGN